MAKIPHGGIEASRLLRRLNTQDAVFIGLGSMIGAGIFTALAPAAAAAGAGLLFGLAIAASVAYCNATSSAQLARLYPASGGTYVYAGERLNEFWAWVAGWGFVVGKLASCSAVALTFGYYLAPEYARFLAAGAVIAFTALNFFGIEKTARATKIIVVVVLLSLSAIVALVFAGEPDIGNLSPILGPNGLYGILQSAGIWFFAFAGYSRIATLAEEVEDPETSIPRAIVLGLCITLFVYAVVVVSALLLVGPAALARSDAPLVTALAGAGFQSWQWIIRVGSTFATLGVLLSLMTGISRMLFAMAADQRMPSILARVHPVHRVPHLAELTVGVILVVVVLLADLRAAIGFSSFTVLLYYAVTNLSAYTLSGQERLYSRNFALLGLLGCLLLAFMLPATAVGIGSAVMLAGIPVYLVQRRRSS
ncbi:amino acid permease [Methanoculleus sp. YWC-01]|uniref:Amino acid permease n=1 Tax=Methanoculleus nereidis TaxID=2735141 RepID=A0ABU3Z4L2_9EURY|nr:amino acid permease [Methanoculleus sp. YWC-01]MDV4343766.1 amino acid permease [Methanoculleus sp. YWC-01]